MTSTMSTVVTHGARKLAGWGAAGMCLLVYGRTAAYAVVATTRISILRSQI
jgi:hypothetical protein